jgi:hypothetical protein
MQRGRGHSMLPPMNAGRFGCCGCVMSDGRFAVLGGSSSSVMTERRRARRCPLVMVGMHTGRLCRPCATRGSSGSTSLAGLSPGASSSPEGVVVNQLNCTMRSWSGGCGFLAICLVKIGSLTWGAPRFCRRMKILIYKSCAAKFVCLFFFA